MEISERDIQNWLVDLVKNGSITTAISNTAEVMEVLDSLRDPNRIPGFTVDYMTRRRTASAAELVLANLSPTDLVSADTSVSRTSGQTLRPDIVAYNHERNCIIVFEIKKDSQTARQAITELLAYEQELQNHFPFTSDLDINFVLVAKEWSTLMDHAVASMVTWSSKVVVGLELDTSETDWQLRFRFPNAWHSLASIGLPSQALSVVTLCMYQKNSTTDDTDENPPQQLITALEAIARAGDRSNSHGFAFLWRDFAPHSQCRWMYTIGSLDPFKFYMEANLGPEDYRESELTEYFQLNAAELAGGNHPDSLFRIAEPAVEYLRGWWDPMYEGFESWESAYKSIRTRSRPIVFEFWGALGDYCREFVMHPGGRAYMPEALDAGYNWRDPEVALPLLDDLTGARPIPHGVLTAQACFEIGVVLGVWIQINGSRGVGSTNSQELYECMFHWQDIKLIGLLNELRYQYYAASDIEIAPPRVTVGASYGDQRGRESIGNLINWIRDNLIGKSHVPHQAAFDAGLVAAPYFDQFFHKRLSDGHIEQISKEAHSPAAALTMASLALWKNLHESQSSIDGETKEIYEGLLHRLFGVRTLDNTAIDKWDSLEARTILDSLVEYAIPLFDAVAPPVWHKLAPSLRSNIDWTYFKEGVRRMFDRGEKYPCVILDPDGSLGTGVCTRDEMRFMAPLENPAEEVFYWNRMPGLEVVSRISWNDLKMNFERGD